MADHIFSKRLEIRPFAWEDITDEYIGWLNDRDLMKHSRQRLLVHTRESCESYLETFEYSPNFFWNVGRARQVGTVTAYVSPVSQVANVGLMIGEPGRGYGSEAFGAVLTYLFEYRDVRKVAIGTLAANEPMVRIAARWGLRREGELREQERVKDKWVDVYRLGILRPEWMALEERSPITVEIR